MALSYEGTTAAIGGYSNNSGVGAVWIFTRSGEAWSQQGKTLTGGEETGEGYFGFSVALTHDGKTLLVGGEGDKEFVGAAWEFKYLLGKWTQQGKKITGEEETGKGAFGSGVALDAEGDTGYIGGEYDHEDTGAGWAFA